MRSCTDESHKMYGICNIIHKQPIWIYMTFPDAGEWKDRIFTGVIEQAARDHFVISDPKTGKWYLLLSIYLV